MRNRMVFKKWVIGLTLLFSECFSITAQEVKVSLEDKFPIEISEQKGTKSDLIIYVTGDGGWNKFSRNFVHEFEKLGYGVVSLNSFEYFREGKSPTSFARDLGLLSDHYLKEWNKSSIIIVGYSFGADVASFLPNYLTSQLKGKVKKVALLSPSASTDFVIKISDLLGWDDNKNGKFKVQQEIEKSQLPIVCIFGKEEKLLLKKSLKTENEISVYELPGGHRFDDNFNGLVQIITS